MRYLGLGLLLMLMQACGPQYINGTTLEDNPENRALTAVVETYRLALEQRDVEALSQIISEEYFESGGTTNLADDDYGFKGAIQKVIPLLDSSIEEVHLKMDISSIEYQQTGASVLVDYDLKFRYVMGEKKGWSSKKDSHRLLFVKDAGVWKLKGGL